MIEYSRIGFAVVTTMALEVLAAAIVPQFSAGAANAKLVQCCASQSNTASTVSNSGGHTAQAARPGGRLDQSQLSFYSVPLVCPAAQEIACGTHSKPVLLDLDRQKAISEAWLNRPGTVIAVRWAEESRTSERAAAIEATAKKEGVSMVELSGADREKALKDFAASTDWYRSWDLDRLSQEEADVIAARFVGRVRATIALSDRQADQLRKALGPAIERILLEEIGDQSPEEVVLSAGRKYLDAKGIAALEVAMSKGEEALPGEK